MYKTGKNNVCAGWNLTREGALPLGFCVATTRAVFRFPTITIRPVASYSGPKILECNICHVAKTSKYRRRMNNPPCHFTHPMEERVWLILQQTVAADCSSACSAEPSALCLCFCGTLLCATDDDGLQPCFLATTHNTPPKQQACHSSLSLSGL